MKLEAGKEGVKYTGFLPQDEEGDIIVDEGDRDACHQSDQVWRKDGRYSSVMVAIKDDSVIPFHIYLSPEPTKEEHPRNSPNKEDGLRKMRYVMTFLQSSAYLWEGRNPGVITYPVEITDCWPAQIEKLFEYIFTCGSSQCHIPSRRCRHQLPSHFSKRSSRQVFDHHRFWDHPPLCLKAVFHSIPDSSPQHTGCTAQNLPFLSW